ncbi:MAG: hypothetical protein ACKOS8_05355 [Gemmataceae bacterium]
MTEDICFDRLGGSATVIASACWTTTPCIPANWAYSPATRADSARLPPLDASFADFSWANAGLARQAAHIATRHKVLPRIGDLRCLFNWACA